MFGWLDDIGSDISGIWEDISKVFEDFTKDVGNFFEKGWHRDRIIF